VGMASWTGNRSVATKILTAVGTAGAAACLVAASGVNSLGVVRDAGVSIYRDNLTPSLELATLDGLTNDHLATALRLALTADPAVIASLTTQLSALEAQAKQPWDAYAATAPSPDEKVARDRFTTDYAAYLTLMHRTFLPSASSTTNAASAQDSVLAEKQLIPAFDAMSKDLVSLESIQSTQAQQAAASADSTYSSSRWIVLGALAAGLALAIALGLAVARTISRPLTRCVAALRAVQAGDLTVSAGVDRGDEIGQLGRALDETTGSLSRIIGSIRGAAERVSESSGTLTTVSAGITDSAHRTSAEAMTAAAAADQVSGSVQSVASASEEMTATIGDIAANAANAAEVAKEATDLASTTMTAVTELGDASSQVGDVIRLIRSIAEQTNLLALNATIEAARAGSAGKGFAVVADEVKQLAQQTAQATEDVSTKIAAIQNGTNGAISAIAGVTEVISRVHDYTVAIAGAVEEQNATTAEVNRTVSEAANGTQGIATNIGTVADAARSASEGAERAHTTAESLAAVSTELGSLVAHYRT